MTGENEMPDVIGIVENITAGNITTKAGKSLNKFEITIGGNKYSGIGNTPKVAIGNTVTLKLKQNGNFVNLTDVIMNGTSLMPKSGGFNRGPSGPSTKVLMVQTAVAIAIHNSQGKAITPADIQSLMPELLKMAAD